MSDAAVAVEAQRLEKHPAISLMINRATAKAEEESGVTREWALKRLHETAERCAQAEPVRDRKGNVIEGEFQFREMGVIAAISSLAKLQGWNEPEKIDSDVTVHRGLSDAEAAAIEAYLNAHGVRA